MNDLPPRKLATYEEISYKELNERNVRNEFDDK
jgi:hypothetical protein